MSRRSIGRAGLWPLGGLLVVAGLALAIGGWVPTALFSSAEAPATDESAAFAKGAFEPYFNERELADLGLADEVDPANVRYRSGLDKEKFSPGCAGKDCILSIDDPSFVPADEADSWLSASHRVISLDDDGSARAYPFGILNYHEVVNDRLDDTPIAVTYCPLCRSALVFVRPTPDSTRLTFGVAGRLYRDNLILYDRPTGSYWSQLQARPIVGPLVGSGHTLQRRAMDILRWKDWTAQYPNGQVLARPEDGDALGGRDSYTRPAVPSGMARSRGGRSRDHLFDYGSDPYADYAADPQAGAEDFDDDRLASKAVVIGIETEGGLSVAVPEERLDHGETLEVPVDGRAVEMTRSESGEIRAQIDDGAGARRELAVTTAYWFAWLSFHPKTAVLDAEMGSE